MKISAILAAATLAAAAVFGTVQTSSAQATRTWISGVGDDANPCSRTAPCKTFAGAISKTAAGGEINCIDHGAYGTVTITKSINLSCEGVTAGVLHSGMNGIIINAASTDVINLRGLDINGGTPSAAGLNGVRILNAGRVNIDNCMIRNSIGASPYGYGVLVAPTAGKILVNINDSNISNNGAASTGAAVQVEPNGSGSVVMSISNTKIFANTMGVRGFTNATTGSVEISISNSLISGNTFHGVVAQSEQGSTKIMIDNTQIVGNLSHGIRSVDANSIIRVNNSTITGNLVGLLSANGGSLRSYGNNALNGNGTDGAFTGAAALQ